MTFRAPMWDITMRASRWWLTGAAALFLVAGQALAADDEGGRGGDSGRSSGGVRAAAPARTDPTPSRAETPSRRSTPTGIRPAGSGVRPSAGGRGDQGDGRSPSRSGAGVGVRRADISVRPMKVRVGSMNITPPKMDITPPRMNITQRPMNITPPRMNITPSRRMNTMPDYDIPKVVTPRKRDLIPTRSADEAARGIRPASPDRIIVTSRRAESGYRGPSSDARLNPRGEGRGEGRGDDRGEVRGEGRGDRDGVRDHDDRVLRAADAERLRDQRDRNMRGDDRGGRDSSGEGRGNGRGNGNNDRRDDRDRHDDRSSHDRYSDDRGWDERRWQHDHYRESHRGYLISRPRDYFLCDRPTYRYTGSGLTVRGGYLGDRFNVDARLTSGVFGLDGFRTGTFYPSSTWLSCDNGWVGGHWNGYYWSSFDVPYGYPSTYWSQRGARTDLTDAIPASDARVVEGDYGYGEVVTGDVRMRDMRTPVQMPVAVDDSGMMTAQSLSPVSEFTPLDNGIMALMDGDASRGADELRVHLREHRDDGRALRLLAVALAEASQPVDAAAVMRMAHEMDPALATETVGLSALGYDDGRLRDLVDKSVVHAHRVKSQHSTEAASAWLTVGVLMREQGRDDLAREMIKRAERAGLRADVVETLELAWR